MIRAPPSVITGGGVCCFRPLHPLWYRRDGYGLQAYAEARKRALQGFLTGEGTLSLNHTQRIPKRSDGRYDLRHYLRPRQLFVCFQNIRLTL